jgi:putative transposase
MTRTYRYPLRPTKAQEATLLAWLGFCQRLYNAALEHRIGAWRRARKSVSLYAQTTELAVLRSEDSDAAAVPSDIARSALRRLDRAFQAFFRRCRSGEKPGFPRFRGRDWYDSFSFPAVRVEGNRVHVPKLGPVRFHDYRPLQGEVREVTIRRGAGRWWVSFSCDLGDAPPKVAVRRATGIDLGLTTFATLSDGSEVPNPRYFRAGEQCLAWRQQALARKCRGSKSRARAKLLVQKAHEHTRNQRLDFSRKLAAQLYAEYDLIAYEDLAIRNMIRGPLAKSIGDAAWGTFIRCLTSRAESAGRHAVAVDPRGTSQRCSGCGTVVPKALSERVHRCPCGLVLSRDQNAALNVLALGRSAVGLAPPEVLTPTRC